MSDLPGLSDVDLSSSGFKSLTAQKLMAGLSFNSIDTLLEVNAAAEGRAATGGGDVAAAANVIMNQSTETVDFGVI